MSKKNNEMNLFNLGLSSLVLSGAGAFWLGSLTTGLGFLGIGTAAIAMHLFNSTDEFKKLWKNCGLYNKDEKYPLLKYSEEKPYGCDYIFKIPTGLSSDDFKKKQLAIEENLNSKVDIEYKDKNLIIKVYTNKLNTLEFTEIKTQKTLEFPIGYSYNNLEKICLTNGSPHLLIAGETGSGKSTTLRGIITSLILNNNSNKLDIDLVDLKNGAEFNIFRKCNIVKNFCRTIEETEELLYKTIKEVDKRYDLFFKNNCVDIKEYNKKNRRNKLKYKVIVVDEFADLQNEKDSIKILESLAAKTRACGIHLIISTQRPDSKILNGRIKANIPVVLGLKTMNEVNSRIIIDHKGLETLRGKGNGILKFNGKETEIQSMNLTPDKARDLVSPYYVNKEIKKIKSKNKEELGKVDNFDFLRRLNNDN